MVECGQNALNRTPCGELRRVWTHTDELTPCNIPRSETNKDVRSCKLLATLAVKVTRQKPADELALQNVLASAS
jgi:hypothetical protein